VIKTLRALVRKSEGRREWHDPNDLVKAAVHFIEPEVADAGILLTTRLTEVLPYVQVDAIQIEQVVLNLLRNALDALDDASDRSRREIRVATAAGPANDVEISVTDSGSGVEPHAADYVFDEFFTTKADGLGLGLSISRSIVEAHGGRLWVTANPNRGAAFHFTLPLDAAESGADAA
jgi:signal transduction histidine kinase